MTKSHTIGVSSLISLTSLETPAEPFESGTFAEAATLELPRIPGYYTVEIEAHSLLQKVCWAWGDESEEEQERDDSVDIYVERTVEGDLKILSAKAFRDATHPRETHSLSRGADGAHAISEFSGFGEAAPEGHGTAVVHLSPVAAPSPKEIELANDDLPGEDDQKP